MPVTPNYKAALIGLTGIGAQRPPAQIGLPLGPAMPTSHASAFDQHPRTDLVAVCDLNQDLLKQFRQTWSDIWPDMRYYTDANRMLAEIGPDLVSIATSDHAHADLCVAAAARGCRGIFCEKPIATSLQDADRMIAACTEKKIPLSIDHTRRWAPAFLQARHLITSGELGPVRTISAELFSTRAMLFRNGTHLIDMICFFATNASPRWVSAELEEGFEDFSSYQGDGGRDPGTDPAASAYIRFDGGIRAFFNAYKTQFPGSQVTVTCEQGRIEISDRSFRLIRGQSNSEWAAAEIPSPRYLYQGQLGAVDELVKVLDQGGDLVSSGVEARKTLEIILAMLKSHQQNNSRVDLPL
jgi:predicted dehydrogenase